MGSGAGSHGNGIGDLAAIGGQRLDLWLRPGRARGSVYPGADPFGQLEAALSRVATGAVPTLRKALESGPRGLLPFAVEQVLPPGARLVLLIDQLEELFTLTGDEESANASWKRSAWRASTPTAVFT